MASVTIYKDPEQEQPRLLIDGTPTDVRVDGLPRNSAKPYFASVSDEATLNSISDVSVGSLLNCLESLRISFYDGSLLVDNGWQHADIEVDGDQWCIENGKNVRIAVQFDWEEWARPYSIRAYAAGLLGLLTTLGSTDLYWPAKGYYANDDRDDDELGDFLNGFGIVSIVEPETTIAQLLIELPKRLQNYFSQVEIELLQNQPDAVNRIFSFPDSLRASCEQYLMYFGQFLSDLGIEATTELKEEASRVLFRVVPSNKNEALEVIQQALDTYLRIPGSPSADAAMANSSEIAVLQLNANVSHLRAQLFLAAAVAQAKDATISAQQTEIANLRGAVDLTWYAPKLPSSSDSEQLVGDLVSVKKLEYKGFEFNFPEILRRLKRKLK
jgi:hypothetical protein